MNKIQGYTMGYDLYINDKIKNNCINRNLKMPEQLHVNYL